MKTIILKTTEDNLNTLESIIPGLYLNVGDWYQSNYLKIGKKYSSTEYNDLLFLFVHIGRGFPVPINLPQGDNTIRLTKKSKNLTYLECNEQPIACFAVQDGIFSISEEYAGVLFYYLSYETVFPDFSALPYLKGLYLGYSDNIKDWDKLSKASTISTFSAIAYSSSWAKQLNCNLKVLSCTSSFFDQIHTSVLQDTEVLFIEGGDNTVFEKIFRLPSLQIVYLDFSYDFQKEMDWMGLCSSLARIIDPLFPDTLAVFGAEKTKDYSEYMSSITEYITNYGNETKGLEVKTIHETTGDYPMSSCTYIEIRTYGILNFGSVFFKQTDKLNRVQFVVKTTREKALLILNKITGLNATIVRDSYNKSFRTKVQVMDSKLREVDFKDPNRIEFDVKTNLFLDKITKIIIPMYKYVAEELKGQGIEVEFRHDIDHRDNPMYYSASAWFSIYKSDLSQSANFQYSQSGSRLDPIIESIWNPDKWENYYKEIPVEEITSEQTTAAFFAFLKSVSSYFKYKWEY